jgi:hypothetical protein
MKKRIESLEQYESQVTESFFSNMGVGEYQRITNWLDEVGIRKYTINKDLTVDVDGHVDLNGKTFEKLSVRFGKVSGYFSIYGCKNLKSLDGCPSEVGDVFTCSNCPKLKSLDGCPSKVGLDFWCYECGTKFTEAEVQKLCKVRGVVYV